jgi:YD repeat-containing protein
LERLTKHIIEYNTSGSNKLQLRNTTAWDIDHRQMVENRITDLQQEENFDERYSYEKYHKTYRAKEVLKYKNGDLLNRSAFTYTPENGNPQLYQLRKSEVAKDDRPLETEQEITRYDAYGNVLEYRTKEGLYVSQIWGYHETKIVCELKNIRYQDIDAGIIAGIHYQTNLTDNSYNENYIRTQYQILRQAHPQSMVTSYTYRPMIGMSSLTDTNGRTEYYEYDKFNRLSVVKDHDGNRLKAYEYHYKN